MKRFLTLLAALLCVAGLAACHRYLPEHSGSTPEPEPAVDPAADPVGTAEDEPLELDALNVEFVASGRDVDELFALRQAFPTALKTALGKRGVKAGEVAVTFGTSDEATAEALQSGAVDVGFLAVGTVMENGLKPEAVERYDVPDLALTALAPREELPAKLTEALLAALPDLKDALARYTGTEQGGVFAPCTNEMLENLIRLQDTGETVLHTEAAHPAGRDLELRGVGRRVNDYDCVGIRTIEVWDNDAGAMAQTIEMSEAGEDLPMVYTDCWKAEELFRVVDVNFDGCDDIEVFGWAPSNTVPYLYWIWNGETQRYEYAFTMQVAEIDPETQTLRVEYNDGPGGAEYRVETYGWQDGELALLSRE